KIAASKSSADDVASNADCAASTRSVRGIAASPKRPYPKVIVHTAANATMSPAEAANTGGQRAATQNAKGNTKLIGKIVNQCSVGELNPSALTKAIATSATSPSSNCRFSGGLCAIVMSPITTGATVTTPRASDANQANQILGADAPKL